MTELEKLEAEKLEIEKRIEVAKRVEVGKALAPTLERLIGMGPDSLVVELEGAIRAGGSGHRPAATAAEILHGFQKRETLKADH